MFSFESFSERYAPQVAMASYCLAKGHQGKIPIKELRERMWSIRKK